MITRLIKLIIVDEMAETLKVYFDCAHEIIKEILSIIKFESNRYTVLVKGYTNYREMFGDSVKNM